MRPLPKGKIDGVFRAHTSLPVEPSKKTIVARATVVFRPATGLTQKPGDCCAAGFRAGTMTAVGPETELRLRKRTSKRPRAKTCSGPSAPADSIDRTTTIHRRSRPYRSSRRSSRDRSRSQHHTSPRDAPGRIIHVLAVNYCSRRRATYRNPGKCNQGADRETGKQA
jgi:hypothetical protein